MFWLVITGVVALFVGVVGGYFLNNLFASKSIKNAQTQAKKIIEDALKDAANKKKEYLLQAKEEAYKFKKEVEEDLKEKENGLKKFESRLQIKEEKLGLEKQHHLESILIKKDD